MPKRGKNPPDPARTWMGSTQERFRESRNVRPSMPVGKGSNEADPVEVAGAQAHMARMTLQYSSVRAGVWQHPDDDDDETVVPDVSLPTETVAMAHLDYYRRGPGVTATGFEPTRHTMMVLGRPVQV